MKQYVIKRLSERSTWAGLGVILAVAGINVSPESVETLVSTATAVGGVIAIITKTSGNGN